MPDQNLLLRDLPPSVLEKLKPRLRIQTFVPGQVLFAAGDKISNIHFMRSGAVSLSRDPHECAWSCPLRKGPLLGFAWFASVMP